MKGQNVTIPQGIRFEAEVSLEDLESVMEYNGQHGVKVTIRK